MSKQCTKCKEQKELECFHKSRDKKDGLSNKCKKCRSKETKTYYEKHKDERLEYAKEQYSKDPDKILKRNNIWRNNNPEQVKECRKVSHDKWYSKEENRQKKSEYGVTNRPKIREYYRTYRPEREKVDIAFKISNRLRTRMNMALRKGYKTGSAVRDLGCSMEEFIKYIESLWEPGMTWDNYGRKQEQWSLDHTLPLSSFDLMDRKQFLIACHYTNMRPMWHIKNMRKHNKIPK